MKKTHILLLLITAILALSSAYSLAAFNQVYNIAFEWYSQYDSRYDDASRDISQDRFLQAGIGKDIKLGVIGDSISLQSIREAYPLIYSHISGSDVPGNVYLYCALGKVNSPEYRIKVASIAQRGNTVEIKVSVNTPSIVETTAGNGDRYEPVDIVKISRDALPSRGRLYFVFKDQNGRQLHDEYCYVW